MKTKIIQAIREDAARLVAALRRLRGGGTEHVAQRFVGRLEEAYGRGWRECPCVFVLSTGRVGSQTLTALLALSPQVVAEHEPLPRLVKTSFDAYLERGDLAASRMWREIVYASRDDLVCEANRRGKIYFESNNRLTYLAPVLAECFPSSRFIHLHRDPFAVVRSAMRRGYYESHNWDFARVRPRPGEPLAREWDALPRLEKCAWFWSRINEEAHDFLATLPPERALDLRSELLFGGDASTLQRIFAFVGVEPSSADQIDRVLGRKLNASSPGDAASTAWSESEHAAVWRRVEAVAVRLGYAEGDRPCAPRPRPQSSAGYADQAAPGIGWRLPSLSELGMGLALLG